MPTPDTIRNEIAKKFICASHMPAIESAAKKGGFAVTFREAGVHTINALNCGAAAKGHNILEKTIKESSIKAAYGDRANVILAMVKAAGIVGYVGHWDKETKELIGIYINYTENLPGDIIKHCPMRKYSIYMINVNHLSLSLLPLNNKKIELRRLAFSGDYDMHDMIIMKGAGRPRTVLMHEEENIINEINKAIAAVDTNRPFNAINYNVIRHGPQVNFVSFMRENEREVVNKAGGYLGAVANPGEFPLAAINRGEWSIINNLAELQAFYKKSGAVIKSAWSAHGSRVYLPVPGRPGLIQRGTSACEPSFLRV